MEFGIRVKGGTAVVYIQERRPNGVWNQLEERHVEGERMILLSDGQRLVIEPRPDKTVVYDREQAAAVPKPTVRVTDDTTMIVSEEELMSQEEEARRRNLAIEQAKKAMPPPQSKPAPPMPPLAPAAPSTTVSGARSSKEV